MPARVTEPKRPDRLKNLPDPAPGHEQKIVSAKNIEKMKAKGWKVRQELPGTALMQKKKPATAKASPKKSPVATTPEKSPAVSGPKQK